MQTSVNNLSVLQEIKEMCYKNNDDRATWIGPNLPSTDVNEYKNFAKWALEHLKMYEGFYHNLDKNPSYKILDIACGPGYNTNMLSYLFPNSEITGVDIDKDSIAFANKYNKNSNITFLVDSILTYYRENYYDIIFCLETLEHIKAENHIQVIRKLLECLSSTGRLFLSTPHEESKDLACGHVGIMNSQRFNIFKEIFKDNIRVIKYYNNKKLLSIEPLSYIVEEKDGSHFSIVLSK